MLVCALIVDFAAQAELRAAPTRAPLLLVAGTRPIVAALDARAGAAGVRRGMPLKRARAVCPEAEVRSLVEARLSSPFEALLSVVGEFTGRFEVQPPVKGADPVVWLDVGTGADAAILASQLRAGLREQAGLTAELGAAAGKFPAFAAAVTGGVTLISPGRERAMLAPRPVELLPLLPDERRHLALFGLRTLGHLAALPRAAALAQFGMRGKLLHQLACGEDPRPLHPYQPPPVERLRRRFSDPLADEAQFDRALDELAAEAADRLRAKGAACGRMLICLTNEAGEAREAARALREPVAEERALGRLLHGLCAALPRAGVVGLELELSGLQAGWPQQLRLFDEPAQTARTTREVARALMLRHPPAAFVTPVVPDDADMMPESVTFVPLDEDV